MLVADGIVNEFPNVGVYLPLVVSIKLVVEILELVFIHRFDIDGQFTDDFVLLILAQIVAQCAFPLSAALATRSPPTWETVTPT